MQMFKLMGDVLHVYTSFSLEVKDLSIWAKRRGLSKEVFVIELLRAPVPTGDSIQPREETK